MMRNRTIYGHILTIILFLSVMLSVIACGAKETPAPTPTAIPPTATPVPSTATPTPDLIVPKVEPILPEAQPTPEITPAPVPTIQVQSALVEAPDLTSNIFVEYILDASGSMLGQLADHTRKRDVAEKVLSQRIRSFPSQIHIGFRAFGHHMDWRGQEEKSCQDIELIAPVQTGQLEKVALWLEDDYDAKGMTPLAQAIRYAAEDLPKEEDANNAIVLISDGKETCGGDPCAVVKQIREMGIHFTLHVVGMNVQPEDAEQLLCVARAGQGYYIPVQTAQEMNRALETIEKHIAEGNEPMVAQLPPTPTPIPPTPTPEPPTPTPELQAGATKISPIDGMEMVYVPAGEFLMGSPEGEGYDNEHPQHAVYLNAFWIDKTEVTNAMFEQFVSATGHKTTAEREGCGWVYQGKDNIWECVSGADWRHPQGPESDLDGLENHPVVIVSWDDAKAYCEWADKRLPTEAEWEKAARSADGRRYPWGNQEPNCDLANFWGCVGHTSNVGSYLAGASPYGALDMAGNVWEWVADWYDANYYAFSPARNPTGPASGDTRVLRGGSWHHSLNVVRSAFRVRDDPDFRIDFAGFRCVRPSD